MGESRDAALDAEVQVLSSFVKHLAKYKCITLEVSREELARLIEEGVIVSPDDAIDKTDDRGRKRVEKLKDGTTLAKKRTLLDHSDNKGGRIYNPFATGRLTTLNT